MMKNISNLGDAALYCDFGIEVNKKINSEVIKYFKAIKEKNIQGINNLTPSYNKLIISYDLKITKLRLQLTAVYQKRTAPMQTLYNGNALNQMQHKQHINQSEPKKRQL